jgi:hypothetical protein
MSDLEKNLRAHGYKPGEVESGDYCAEDTTALLGEYILEVRRLKAENERLRVAMSEAIAIGGRGDAADAVRLLRQALRGEGE